MKSMLILFSLLITYSVSASECDDALEEFTRTVTKYASSSRLDYDKLKALSEGYDYFLSQAQALSCGVEIYSAAKDLRESVRTKRLETIQKQLKYGIKREAEIDLAFEVGVLTNEKVNYVYPFSDFVGAYKLGKTDFVVEFPPEKKPVATTGESSVNPPSTVPGADSSIAPPVSLPGSKAQGGSSDKPSEGAVAIVPLPKKEENNTGQSCTEILLENEAVNTRNTRNQDTIGWCYAYTAADLLSFHYNEKISAMSLYSRYSAREEDGSKYKLFEQINDPNKQGGSPRVVVNNFKRDYGGFCLESDLHSSDYNFCHFKDIVALLNFIQNDHTPVEEWNVCMKKDIKEVFPLFTAESFAATLARVNYQNIAETLIKENCRNIKFKDRPVEIVNDQNSLPVDMIGKINKRLNLGKPMGIGYDILNLQGKPDEGKHGSIVMGRKYNREKKKCEYLIRNSWGKDCSITENDKIRCHQECDSANHCRETGYLWVGENDLQDNITGVFYAQ
ncbi:MAG: hypothetical protein KBD76_07855 [Bacteriovorax sp.]|nr:hypothetical protein [Bacteriovorax sp.]